MMEADKPSYVKQDLYRDTPVRYLGYANEIGEAFRPVVPRSVVNMSYAVAIAYVLADCADKTHTRYKSASFENGSGSPTTKAAITSGDVFLWQMMASIIVPGFVINRVTWGTKKLLKTSKIKGLPRKWGATLAGLACIPIIISPIDHSIDILLNYTYRKWIGH